MKLLVTGGAGYIGSHTIVELFEQGYKEIYSIDNHLNSDKENYTRIKKITGESVIHYEIDLTNLEATRSFFERNKVDAIIHFAALKSVPESVENPTLYYRNNILSLLNILECMKDYKVKNLIFSSSCSIYGNPQSLPVKEATPMGIAESPYASTKQVGEMLIKDFCKANKGFNAVSLRYFNPAGAHATGLLGETISKRPNNLVPIITQTAAKLRPSLTVFGTNYNTKDGSCIRDYIHVIDLAKAHIKALEYQHKANTNENYSIFNIGTGKGCSVLELIDLFEKLTQQKLNYILGERRDGDVEEIYADSSKATASLGWSAKYSIEDMLLSAWTWQNNNLNSSK